MKNHIITLSTLFVMLMGALQAQEINPEKNNYLILSKNIQQLKPAILTASSLVQEDVKLFGEFYIIICGKTVLDIPQNKIFNDLLEQAEKQNIKVFVCGLSLNKFNVSTKKLPENLTVTKNGILHGFQLKKKGFLTLSI